MSYTKKTWSTGDTITADALNNLESGASANASAIAEIEKELPSYVGADVPRKAAATITPGTANQTIAANQYLTGAQTIKGDSNLVAANIKKGTSIFGVTGTLEAGSTETDKTGTGAYIWEKRDEKIWWVENKSKSTSSKPSGYGTTKYSSRTITDDGHYSLSNSGISLDEYYLPTGATNGKTKTILYKPYSAFGASYYVCTLSDEKGKTGKKGDTILGYISADSESAYPNSGVQGDVFYTLIKTPAVNVTANQMLDGIIACGQSGKVKGTIKEKSSATITPGTSDQTISSGQYLSGAQTIKGDANLVAANIKRGVSIFGVTGALESGSGGGSGGVAVKTGTFTGNGGASEVDTGLSSILYFIAYDSTKSVHAEGLVVAIMDSAHSVSELGVSCSSYSQYFKNIGVIKSGILTISGGKVSFPGASTTNAPISNTTYNWVAVGEA